MVAANPLSLKIFSYTFLKVVARYAFLNSIIKSRSKPLRKGAPLP